MPEPGELAHVIGYLDEVGGVRTDGDKLLPVDWSDINAWSRLTRTEIEPGEAFAIRRLSAAVAHQAMISREPGQPSPFEPRAPAREVVAKKVETFIAALRGARRG